MNGINTLTIGALSSPRAVCAVGSIALPQGARQGTAQEVLSAPRVDARQAIPLIPPPAIVRPRAGRPGAVLSLWGFLARNASDSVCAIAFAL